VLNKDVYQINIKKLFYIIKLSY